MGELTKLANIGQELEKQLNETGIYTFQELKTIGSKQAWLNIKSIDSSACYNRLCALEGAILNVRWHYLSDAVKKDLKDFHIKFK